MMRLVPECIAKLALLDTSARPDMPEQKAGREKLISMAEYGKLDEVVEMLAPRFLPRNRVNDEALRREIRAMAQDTGPAAFVREIKAIMSRADARLLLTAIRCPTLVLIGEGDEPTPPELAQEIANGISGA